jgi:thiol:disulfide interchange protein
MKEFVVAELYTDVHKQYRQVQNKRFKSVALPLYVVLGPDGQERARLAGRISLDQFLDFLRKGRNGSESSSATK